MKYRWYITGAVFWSSWWCRLCLNFAACRLGIFVLFICVCQQDSNLCNTINLTSLGLIYKQRKQQLVDVKNILYCVSLVDDYYLFCNIKKGLIWRTWCSSDVTERDVTFAVQTNRRHLSCHIFASELHDLKVQAIVLPFHLGPQGLIGSNYIAGFNDKHSHHRTQHNYYFFLKWLLHCVAIKVHQASTMCLSAFGFGDNVCALRTLVDDMLNYR